MSCKVPTAETEWETKSEASCRQGENDGRCPQREVEDKDYQGRFMLPRREAIRSPWRIKASTPEWRLAAGCAEVGLELLKFSWVTCQISALASDEIFSVGP